MMRFSSRIFRVKEQLNVNTLQVKTFKNFGHKKEPIPRFTFYWHAYLTFAFIGMGLNWKRMGRFFFDEDVEMPIPMKQKC